MQKAKNLIDDVVEKNSCTFHVVEERQVAETDLEIIDWQKLAQECVSYLYRFVCFCKHIIFQIRIRTPRKSGRKCHH